MQNSFGEKFKQSIKSNKNLNENYDDLPMEDAYNKIPFGGKLPTILKTGIIVAGIILTIIIIIIVFLFIGRGVKSIDLYVPPVIYVDEEFQVNTKVLGKGNLSKTIIRFNVSDSSVAEILTGAAIGDNVTTTIKGKKNGNVTLKTTAIDNISNNILTKDAKLIVCSRINLKNIASETINLNVGESKELGLNIGDADECKSLIEYSLKDNSIATINDDLYITGNVQGATNLTVTDGVGTVIIHINVKAVTNQILISSFEVDFKSITLKVGDSKQIKTTIMPSNATNKSISWSSTNPEIVTVDNSGKIIAKEAGVATINGLTTDGTDKINKITVTVIK